MTEQPVETPNAPRPLPPRFCCDRCGHRAAVIVTGSRMCGKCFLTDTMQRIVAPAKEMFAD